MLTFATVAAMNAAVYSSWDATKFVRVTSPLAYYVIASVSGGVGTFIQIDNTAIAAGSVTNAMLATMAAHTIKGNNTGATATPLDLTATQVTAELNAMVGDSGSGGTKGLVPAPTAGDAAALKFLKADGTWAVAGTVLTSIANIWDPDIPFSSPSSYDDEFNGTNGSTTGWTTFDNPAGSTTSSTNSMDGSGRWIINQAAQGSFKPVGAYKVCSDTTFCAFLRGRAMGGFASSCIFYFFLGERGSAGAWVTTDATRGVRMDVNSSASPTVADSVPNTHKTVVQYNAHTFTNMGTAAGGISIDRLSMFSRSEFLMCIRLDNTNSFCGYDLVDPGTGRGRTNISRNASVAPSAQKAFGFLLTYNGGAPSNPDPTTPRVELDWFRVVTATSALATPVGRLVTKYYN